MPTHSWSFHVIALYLYKIFKSMLHLQEGATLQSGKYKIEEVLGQGGFGITYLAVQYPLKKKVAIKEFFIQDLCFRDDTASVQVLTPSRRLCSGCYAIQTAHRADTPKARASRRWLERGRQELSCLKP